MCRAYCYVKYCTREDAETAVKKLNNHPIRPGRQLGEIREELRGILEGVEGVRFISSRWLEVEFQSHRLAALARRQLLSGNITIFRTVIIGQVRIVTRV